MTEPKPEYDLAESDVQHAIVAKLEAAGWFVVVTSQDRKTRKQLAGLPDLICFRWGETLLVECKRPVGGKLRTSQRAFAKQIEPHLGACLHYVVAYWPDDVEKWT